MSQKAISVGILQAGRAPEILRKVHGDYDWMCADLVGRDCETTRVFAVLDGQFPDDPETCDAWIVTGSRFGIHDGFDWISRLRAFLLDAYARRLKIVGICFGHQLLADALGGAVRTHPVGPGIGIMDYEMVDRNGLRQVSLPAWHFDQVHTPPAHARVIARSDFCTYAGLSYGDHAISFQAHPEFSTGYLADLVEYYGNRRLGTERTSCALRTLDRQVDRAHVAQLIRDFLGR